MSRITNESDDGMLPKYHPESPLMDESNGGSSGGGVILKKGPWTSSEDAILVEYVKKHGEGNWNAVQKHSGLSRCGKSCRLRWANHLRPNLKKGAFSQTEEAMILDLHAKFGNKWARMATFMPGRTDNEIKNYWNTRVKRRQRAGLPLYPPELQLQVIQENQQGQNTGGMGCVDLGNHDSLQANTYDIPDVVFNSLNRTADVYSYNSDFSDMGTSLMKTMASPQYYGFSPQTVHRQKRLREPSGVFPDTSGCVQNGYPPQVDQFQDDTCHKIAGFIGHSFPQDLDPGQSLLSFDATQGVHSLPNGNSSASMPTSGAVKSELPSLQYQVDAADFIPWGPPSSSHHFESIDAFIQSPRFDEPELPFLERPKSGLLGDLVCEAKNMSSSQKPSSERGSISSNFTTGDKFDGSSKVSEFVWDVVSLTASTPGQSVSVTSYFDDGTGTSTGGSSLDETPPTSRRVKPEPDDIDLDPRAQTDIVCQDGVLLEAQGVNSDLFNCSGINDCHMVSDAIALLFSGNDMGMADCSNGGSTPKITTPIQSQSYGCYPSWYRMPAAVSQMPSDRR